MAAFTITPVVCAVCLLGLSCLTLAYNFESDYQQVTYQPLETRSVSKKTFYIQLFKLDWHQAFFNCQTHGKTHRLATIESPEEYELLKKEIRKNRLTGDEVWIAGMEFPRRYTYTWMTTGEPIPTDLPRWGPYQPNIDLEDQHCLVLYDGQKQGNYTWYDDSCILKYYFACEYVPCDD